MTPVKAKMIGQKTIRDNRKCGAYKQGRTINYR